MLATAPLAAWAQDARFSQSLTPADQSATGIQKLSPDQLAVLDALVRRDEKIQAAPDPNQPAPLRFSQRLLPAERQSAGLTLLSNSQLTSLDAVVARYESGGENLATTRSGPAVWQPEVKAPGPEVHGMISFTYGTGSGGYSMMGGAMAVSIADPVHGIAIEAGYSEMHGKGPLLGRGCYDRYPGGYPFGFDPWLEP